MLIDAPQATITDHDRYLIYEMLGKEVTFRPHRNGRKGRQKSGVVEQICRNIFENVVELTLNGQLFNFEEPTAIVGHESNIVFLYGDINTLEMTDEELFTEMRVGAERGETLHDILFRTKPIIIKSVIFVLGETVKRPRRTWRKSA